MAAAENTLFRVRQDKARGRPALLQCVAAGLFAWIGYQSLPAATEISAADRLWQAAVQHDAGRSRAAGVQETADALEALADALDPEPLQRLGHGLGEAANYLDQRLAPAAEAVAGQMHDTADRLAKDARLLAELLRAATVDLDVISDVHDSLGRFIEGAEALARVLELPRLPDIRRGLQGLESALAAGADQVDGLASYSYPVVSFENWRPKVSSRQFWPEGSKIAGGMRRAGAGVLAADKELETLGKELPRVQAAVASSKKIFAHSQETLAVVLKNRRLIEPLLRGLPATAAHVAEELPRLIQLMSEALHDTSRIRRTAQEMRTAQELLLGAVTPWTEVRQALHDRAAALRATAAAAPAASLADGLHAAADGLALHAQGAHRRQKVLAWSLIAAALLLGWTGCVGLFGGGRGISAAASGGPP